MREWTLRSFIIPGILRRSLPLPLGSETGVSRKVGHCGSASPLRKGISLHRSSRTGVHYSGSSSAGRFGSAPVWISREFFLSILCRSLSRSPAIPAGVLEMCGKTPFHSLPGVGVSSLSPGTLDHPLLSLRRVETRPLPAPDRYRGPPVFSLHLPQGGGEGAPRRASQFQGISDFRFWKNLGFIRRRFSYGASRLPDSLILQDSKKRAPSCYSKILSTNRHIFPCFSDLSRRLSTIFSTFPHSSLWKQGVFHRK